MTHPTDPSQERFTDTSTQDVRPASDTAGNPSDHLEPHTVWFLAAGLLITKFVDCTGYLSTSSMHSAAGAVLLALSFWIFPISAYTYAVKRTTFGYFSKLHRSRTHAMDCVEARKAEHKTTLAFSVDSLSGLQQLNYTSSPSQRFVGGFAGPLYSAGLQHPRVQC